MWITEKIAGAFGLLATVDCALCLIDLFSIVLFSIIKKMEGAQPRASLLGGQKM